MHFSSAVVGYGEAGGRNHSARDPARLSRGEDHPYPAIPRNASSNTPAGCPPEISHFPSTTTAGTPLIPRETPSPILLPLGRGRAHALDRGVPRRGGCGSAGPVGVSRRTGGDTAHADGPP
jgi:hypothetical protein